MTDDRGRVLVFAPSPLLTVTIEERGGESDVHLHAGGQGVWQARMIFSLGAPVVLCAAFGGETGRVLEVLLERDGGDLVAQHVAARNGAYVHDRRGDRRAEIAEMPGDPLSRHDLDDLYEATLLTGLRSDPVVLSGPAQDQIVPADVYRRLAADLTANGRRVLADLSGERLDAALDGGLAFVKVAHDELVADGRATGEGSGELIKAMRKLREDGAGAVLVSRADEPALAILGEDDRVLRIDGLDLHPADPRGAGDSMTAAVAAALHDGGSMADAVRLGAAAGALNVTRSGLGSSGGAGARELARRVELRPYD